MAFKQTQHGVAFYPYGVLGSGYIVSKTEEEDLRAFLRKFYTLTMIAIPIGLFMGWIVSVLLLVILAIYFNVTVYRLLVHAAKTDERLRFSETQRDHARSFSSARLMFALFFCLALFAIGVLVIWTGFQKSDIREIAVGAACAIFFGACSWRAGYLVRLKWLQPAS
jgi:Ca2+/Na+ antiporter